MKLLVCGSRTAKDSEALWLNLDQIAPKEIIHGGAQGADALAHAWARDHNVFVTVIRPDWNTHGKAAGPIRNRQMVDVCDEVLALWDGHSRGTQSTIEYARKVGKPVRIIPVDVVPL